MQRAFQYMIYDTEKEEYLPGPLRAKEVQEIIGVTGSISERARAGTLYKKRYLIIIVGETEAEEDNWAEEWDKARMKLLRGK